MAYTAVNPVSVGNSTKASHYDTVFNNTVAIYAGAMSITSQAANDLAYFSSSAQIGRIAAAASSVLVTSAGNVPSLSQTLPSAVQDNITRLGTVTAGSFPAANLSGTTLASGVTASSLTSVGTITTGVWNAGALTSSGALTVNGAGNSTFTAGTNALKQVISENTTSGTAAASSFTLNAGTTTGVLFAYSQGYTTSGFNAASAVVLESRGTAGLNIAASDAAGLIRFYTVTSERMRLHNSGGFSLGTTTDPGATNMLVAGTMQHGALTGTNATFTASSSTDNSVTVVNTSAGTTAYARFLIQNSGGTVGDIIGLGTGFTTAGVIVQNSMMIRAGTSAGLAIQASDAAGTIRFIAGGSTEQMRLSAAGGLSIGTTTDPGAARLSTGLGAEATPSRTYNGDLDTGEWSSAANTIDWSTNATKRMTLSTTALTSTLVHLGPDGSAGAPTYSFSGATTMGIYRNSATVVIAEDSNSVISFANAGFTALSPTVTLPTRSMGGTSSTGGILTIGNNTDHAPGLLGLNDYLSTTQYVWADTSGVLRIGSTTPTVTSGDTIGTIVGTQTSTRDTKDIFGLTKLTPERAFRDMCMAPVFDYAKKDHRYGHILFTNTTIDDTPWIGMDPSPEHPHGRSFNPETFAGRTMLSFRRVDHLFAAFESRIAALEGRLAS